MNEIVDCNPGLAAISARARKPRSGRPKFAQWNLVLIIYWRLDRLGDFLSQCDGGVPNSKLCIRIRRHRRISAIRRNFSHCIETTAAISKLHLVIGSYTLVSTASLRRTLTSYKD